MPQITNAVSPLDLDAMIYAEVGLPQIDFAPLVEKLPAIAVRDWAPVNPAAWRQDVSYLALADFDVVEPLDTVERLADVLQQSGSSRSRPIMSGSRSRGTHRGDLDFTTGGPCDQDVVVVRQERRALRDPRQAEIYVLAGRHEIHSNGYRTQVRCSIGTAGIADDDVVRSRDHRQRPGRSCRSGDSPRRPEFTT